jgi:dipeptidyl aminopeptidase/acylaminoacyl peptidase
MSRTDGGDVLEALAGLPTLAHPTVSPDGTEIAFYYDVTGRNELHVLDVDSGEHEPWSDGEVPRNARWGVEWAADGDGAFFHLDEGGNEQNDVHRIDRDGEAAPVVEMDRQVSLFDVGEDGETLLLGSNRDGQMNLYRHEIGGETTKVTDYDRAVWGAHLSPDGDRVAYSTNEAEDYDNRDVYVAGVAPRATEDDSNPRNLEIGETGAEAGPAGWHPDGSKLLVGDNSEDLGRAGVYDLDADSMEWYGDLGYEESPLFFLPDGDRFVVSRAREATSVPVVYDVETGASRTLDLPEGVASPVGGEHVLADGRVVLVHTTPTRRPELVAYDLETDEYETLVEPEYGPFDTADFADAEYVVVESDGVPDTPARAVDHDPYETFEIGALLYDSGERPSPLIVNPHGGPRARDTKAFDLYTQFLVSRGFSVLQVNYRGSTGRGRAFVEELIDDWGGAEQGDVAVAAESVLDRDWIDTDRVVVFGGSYGGYSAYWQLVQYPDLYDAGVAWIGVSDLADMYENTMPHFRTELMVKYLGHPEEAPELYEQRSPTTHAGNVAAPLLVVHGVNDRRVPVSQARLFREALAEAGREGAELDAGAVAAGGADVPADADYEYVELGEEGHASSDIDQKTRTFRVLDDFLDRRVGTRPTLSVSADD